MSETRSQPMRLQKFLSDAGVASRRHAEELILEGRVLVNDQVITQLPAFVDPRHDRVVFDGDLVRIQPPRYYLLNKPVGVVCTNRDPSGRRRAVDFLPPQAGRLFPVGRLDIESAGLLLLTNDGELAARLTHPRYGMPKTYEAEVRGQVEDATLQRMTEGVYLAEGLVRADFVEVRQRSRQRSALRITVHERLNRMVRRMLARLGHEVRSLTRIRVGPLTLRGLPSGACRPLSSAEVETLRAAVARADARPRSPRARPARVRRPSPRPARPEQATGEAPPPRSGPQLRQGPPNRSGPPNHSGSPPRPGPPNRSGPPARPGSPDRDGPPNRGGAQPRPSSPDRGGPPSRPGPPNRGGPPSRPGRGKRSQARPDRKPARPGRRPPGDRPGGEGRRRVVR